MKLLEKILCKLAGADKISYDTIIGDDETAILFLKEMGFTNETIRNSYPFINRGMVNSVVKRLNLKPSKRGLIIQNIYSKDDLPQEVNNE